MNAFRSSGLYQMRLSGEESKRSRARIQAARSVDSTFFRGDLIQIQSRDTKEQTINDTTLQKQQQQQQQQQLYAYCDQNCEVSISSARASVMVYDDVNKKWIPSGSSSGLSKVQLYHHQVNNTFRVVGRKLQDHEIVMNCAILRGLKYNQATVTFHQWRDNKQVYGLNFSSKDDADAFAKAMLQALDVLSNGTNISRNLGPAVAPVTQQQQQPLQQLPYQQQQLVQQPNTQYEEDMGYRTMTREDVAIIQERRMSQQNQVSNGLNAISPSCPSNVNPQQQQQQQQSGHHRTSSAPPAPAPQQQLQQQLQQQQMPPAPPPQPPAAPPAPPCPPSMMNFQGGIAQQYGQSPQSQQTPSPGVGGIYGTTGGQQQLQQQQPQPVGSQGPYQVQQYSPSNQYGSRASLNSQYATLPNTGQYVSQGPYGPVVSQQPQQQIQPAGSPVIVNPYGTPVNSVNQAYAHQPVVTSQADVNAYAPVGSVPSIPGVQPTPPGAAVPPPPPPMAPPMQAAAPPPPPPPPAPSAGSNGGIPRQEDERPPAPDVNSLAAALQAAKLKKKQQSQPIENSGSSTSSSGSGGGNYGTLGRNSGGVVDSAAGGAGLPAMMVEMAKTLARRRAASEKKQPEQPPEPESSPDKKSWDKSNSSISNSASNNKFSNGAESPKAHRKRFGSASEDTLLKVNGVNDGSSITAQELETFKAELMKEVRKEFQKIKQEIVDAVKSELNRR